MAAMCAIAIVIGILTIAVVLHMIIITIYVIAMASTMCGVTILITIAVYICGRHC